MISLDKEPTSNATLLADILKMEPWELLFVPDFIWASLPCHTYSRAAGAHHRSVKKNELEKTREAEEHNKIFLQMVKYMKWARYLHYHLRVVIENPVGTLPNMPLTVRLRRATYNCASLSASFLPTLCCLPHHTVTEKVRERVWSRKGPN